MRHMILCFMLVGVLGTASFAQAKRRPANTQRPAPSPTQASTANSVEGSFVFGKEVVKLSHAYACLVKNEYKKHAQDVLILFMDRPIPREFVDDSDAAGDAKLDKLYRKSYKGLVRGLQVRFDAGTYINAFTIYNGIPFMSHGAEFKPVAFTRSLVQGSVSKKGTFFDDAYEFNVTFKVALRPDGWTGDFVTPTPTKPEQGKAIGQPVINGKATQLNHVYARLEYNLFGEKQNKTVLLFTEKPVPEEAIGVIGITGFPCRYQPCPDSLVAKLPQVFLACPFGSCANSCSTAFPF